jgi:hydrogenase maturation protein HypF
VPASTHILVRRRFDIRGTVQGVGFRPFVFRLAHSHGLTGRVWNDSHGVTIECQGNPAALAAFAAALQTELPPLAHIDTCTHSELPLSLAESEFRIVASAGTSGDSPDAAVTVDSAVCPDCLCEMRDPADRRHGHALINCTNCGPRFSIIREVPYDRQHTTMALFPMCPSCAAEYKNPLDRRFHAQPVCCPDCGPQLKLLRPTKSGYKPAKGDPIATAARSLLDGKILAIKGLGGFHLAVRADDEVAVARLRSFKKRDAKPFALMARDLAAARELVNLSPVARQALASPAAPIVLAPRVAGAAVAKGVAPGTHLLGVMLPYTPIHHLLLDKLDVLAQGAIPPLVMTSGNVSSEPLAIENDDALVRLGPLCDAFLLHDRPIERPVDDSVLLDLASLGAQNVPFVPGIVPIRRSRGYVPQAWRLPEPAPGTGICVGGELKNTVAVVREREVIVSQHLGDLTHPLAFEHFQRAFRDLSRLFDVEIGFIAHDLHPGYMSTQAARALASTTGARLIAVQHHHAHAAAVMAEHGIRGPALAIVCDGTGYGPDGTIWGGEVLLVNRGTYRRIGRLKPMRLPGGDSAAKDPRRSALALLHAVYGGDVAALAAARQLFPDNTERQFLAHMVAKGLSSPWTSSTGRLFDAVAALLGVCSDNSHEAQAAMALEAAAAGAGGGAQSEAAAMQVAWNAEVELWELDPAPLVKSLLRSQQRGEAVGTLAAAFHRELARGFIAMARQGREAEKIDSVVYSGGVFCNARMIREVAQQAVAAAFRPFFHEAYPATDGGVAFGQAAVAREILLTKRF